SFGEVGQTKGYCLFDPEDPQPQFREIPVRPMLDLDPIDATEMDADDLLEAMAGRLQAQPLSGAIVRLGLRHVPPATRANLDLRQLRDLVADALHFAIRWEREGDGPEEKEVSSGTFRPLEDEWRSFMETADVHGRDRSALTRAGLEYLTSVVGEDEPDAVDLFGS
ncbi:MAG TPA: hypothetical protein PLZ94_19175, partial [Armatimonadota bacterium]|nr:hypothetical protein [Armatimonadota bacterium]